MLEQSAQENGAVTIPGNVQKMGRCGATLYGLGAWWHLVEGWTLLSLRYFQTLKIL